MALIREMDISDYSQVIELWSETEAMLLRDADSRENIGKYLERNPNLSFVAVDGDTIVGAILVGTDGRRGYVQHLAVNANCRGKGIGAKLISSAVDALSKIGIAKTHLFVANENLNAQYFYEKLGWFPRDEVRMFSFNSSCSGNVQYAHNKAFKSDSQRLAVSLRSSIAKRRSHLNAALCNMEVQ